jgi:hypothetical protein
VLEKEESINLIIDKTKDTDFKKIKQKSGDRILINLFFLFQFLPKVHKEI